MDKTTIFALVFITLTLTAGFYLIIKIDEKKIPEQWCKACLENHGFINNPNHCEIDEGIICPGCRESPP